MNITKKKKVCFMHISFVDSKVSIDSNGYVSSRVLRVDWDRRKLGLEARTKI